MKKSLLFTILGLLITPLVFSQLYFGASTGVARGKVGAQFMTGWQFNEKWQTGIDMTAQAIHPKMWLGIQGGPVIKIPDVDDNNVFVSPYLGFYYEKVGRTHSNDRYVKDGMTTYLFRDLPTDQFNMGFGLRISRGMWFIRGSSFFNKRELSGAFMGGMMYQFK